MGERREVESEMQEITYMTQVDLLLDLSVHVTSLMRGTQEVLLLTTDVWFLHVGLGISRHISPFSTDLSV